jgi:hypothetical protein
VNVLRRLLSGILISLGVFVLGLWATTSFVVHTVNDGTVVSEIASAALHKGPVQDRIAQQAQALVADQLAANGIDVAASGQQQALNDAIAATVASESFIDDLVGLIETLEASVVDQLTNDSLPEVPLVLTLDISQPLYSAIGATPGLEGLVPPTTLEPVTFEALSGEAVGHVRGGYNWIERVASWGLVAGILLIVLGFLVHPKKRWIIPKLLLRVGVVVLLAWFVLSRITMTWVLDHVPGGAEGGLGTALRDLLPQENVDRLQSGLLKAAIGLFVLAGVAFAVVWFIFRDRKEPQEPKKPQAPSTHEDVTAEVVSSPVTVPAATSLPATSTSATSTPATSTPAENLAPFDQEATGAPEIDEDRSASR